MSKSQKDQSRPKSEWKRWIIVFFCLALIVVRYFYPAVQIDAPTVWLVVIAAIAFLLPELKSFTPYIKRVKIGDTEVELKDEIAKLGNEVEKAKQSPPPGGKKTARKKVTKKPEHTFDATIEKALNDPRATLLILSAKIEEELKKRLVEAGVDIDRVYSLKNLSRLAVDNKLLSIESASALNDFSVVRNKVAHGEAFDVEDHVIYSLISIGVDILKLIMAR
ncbi:MAG TPA: hypothetical protein PKI33_10085 [Anaerolineales bacterium]|nr:hypothetical protein [Anaerolineales bacterium]